MRIATTLVALLGLNACVEGPPASTTEVQEIRAVCAPTETRSDERFVIDVHGGCDADEQRYSCSVSRSGTTVEVKLLGPTPGGACGTVRKPCTVPALPEGTYRFEFLGGPSLNRDVVTAPQHPVFECERPDAGSAG